MNPANAGVNGCIAAIIAVVFLIFWLVQFSAIIESRKILRNIYTLLYEARLERRAKGQ